MTYINRIKEREKSFILTDQDLGLLLKHYSSGGCVLLLYYIYIVEASA